MIFFDRVSKKYEGEENPVFTDFSERIEDGEFIILKGESGIGKTTLIRLITKETEPDSGDITVGRYRLSEIKRNKIPEYRREIGVIFQDFRLFADYTVYGNLELTLSLTGCDRKSAEDKITHVLTMMGIDHLHKRYPRELSGGEQQKVCMARAIINNPMVLLADEPTGNLDPSSSAEIAELLSIIHRHGITVIMATHDTSTVKALGDTVRVISLDKRKEIN
ncbi:MAG: ATP-binding cassette domain-containing protein [Lachnospiraceae bacterium]|nr:ATP-binding cassette domain-containing protein [Lachnospiraceae bacterium]